MTRTDAILLAIRERLDARRQELDSATDLRSLTVDLRFSPGHLEPRAVIDRIERERLRSA